jgi:hypothetical protein
LKLAETRKNLLPRAAALALWLAGSGALAQTDTPTPTPLPAPSFSLFKEAELSTVNPGDYLLFRLDYSFVNTHHFVVTDPIPPDSSLILAGPAAVATVGPSMVTWSLGDAGPAQSGEVYMLLQLGADLSPGTTLVDSASGSTDEVGTLDSNAVTVTVGQGLRLQKSLSPASAFPGEEVTYSLAYSASGETFRLLDDYDGDTVGSGVVHDQDGIPYSTVSSNGEPGTWSVTAGTGGDRYLTGDGNGQFPQMLRNPLGLCPQGTYFIVEGDLQIDPSNACGGPAGCKAAMVVSSDGSSPGSNLYAVVLSADANPYRVFIERTADGTSATPAGSDAPSLQAGSWYSLKAKIQDDGSGGVSLSVKEWPRGTSEPSTWLFGYDDPSPLPCGTGTIGWQAYGGLGHFDNLRMIQPYNATLKVQVWDTVPAGIVFSASNPAALTGPPLLGWSLPSIVTTPSGTIAWSGAAGPSCPATYSGAALLTNSGPVTEVFSNNVDLPVSCAPTATPTASPTFTPMPTPTPTVTSTPTSPPTPTETLTAGDCQTIPAYCYPNPARGAVVDFRFQLCEPAAVRILVYNGAAEKVASYDLEGQEGDNTYPADVSGFAHGVYYYLIRAEEASGTRRSKTALFAVLHSR